MEDGGKNILIIGCFCLFGFLGVSLWRAERTELTWGIVGKPPKSLDPIKVVNKGKIYSLALFSSLYESRCGKLVPVLVEREIKISNRVMVLQLRKGVRFHNGREMTTDDVVFSMHYSSNSVSKGNESQEVLASKIRGVRVRSRYELELELSPVRMDFRKALLFPILPKEEVLREGKEFWQHPIGSGPFRFDKWTRDEIVLVRNESYFEGVPQLKRLRIKFFSSRIVLLSAILSGRVQVTVDIPCRYYRIVGKFEGFDFERMPGLQVWVIVWVGKSSSPAWFKWMRFLFSKENVEDVACVYKWLAVKDDPDRFISLMEEAGWERRDGFWEKDGSRLRTSIYLSPILEDELWPLALVKKLRASGIWVEIVSSPKDADLFIAPVVWLNNQSDKVLDLLYLNKKVQQLFNRSILSSQEQSRLSDFFIAKGPIRKVSWLLRDIYRRRFIFLFIPQRFSMKKNGLKISQGCSFCEMTSSCLSKVGWR